VAGSSRPGPAVASSGPASGCAPDGGTSRANSVRIVRVSSTSDGSQFGSRFSIRHPPPPRGRWAAERLEPTWQACQSRQQLPAALPTAAKCEVYGDPSFFRVSRGSVSGPSRLLPFERSAGISGGIERNHHPGTAGLGRAPHSRQILSQRTHASVRRVTARADSMSGTTDATRRVGTTGYGLDGCVR